MIFAFLNVAGGLPVIQIGMEAEISPHCMGKEPKEEVILPSFLLADDAIDRSGQGISADGVVCIKALRGGF